MPKDTKTLGNNKARAWESLGFVHKKRLGQRFDTTSCLFAERMAYFVFSSTHLRALTNASIHGVTWSLFWRSAG